MGTTKDASVAAGGNVIPVSDYHRRRKLRPSLPDGDIDCTIRQATLEQVLVIEKKIKQDTDALTTLREDIMVLLDAGIPVEPGTRTVTPVAVEVPRRVVETKVRNGCSYRYLIVK